MPTPQDLAAELSQERFALASLLEFARTLTPDLGPRGIIRSVLRSVMGKSLIKEAFAYLADGERYELVAAQDSLIWNFRKRLIAKDSTG